MNAKTKKLFSKIGTNVLLALLAVIWLVPIV